MNEDGTLACVYDKQADRHVLADRGNQIRVYVDKPREWDAWDVEEGYWRQGEEVTASSALEVVEAGPHRAAIRVVRQFRDSKIVQSVRLWANSARIDFKTDIDWHEKLCRPSSASGSGYTGERRSVTPSSLPKA
jgi:alpha-mannosidase